MANKNLNEIRKNITKRKQQRRQHIHIGDAKAKVKSFQHFDVPQEEEKHGYFPFSNHNPSSNSDSLVIPAFLFKALLAGILFVATALILRMDVEALDKPRNFMLSALTEDFNFAKVQGWYRDNLGTPFAFLNESNSKVEHVSNEGLVLPVNGSISESFQETGEGVMIEVATQDDMSVTAMEAGTIVFAGNDKETGKTIIIQHEDGSNSIYGNLDEMDVFQYQFVSKNEIIGTLKPQEGSATASLYFAIKNKRTFVDPIKVIQVDDQN